MPWQRIASPSLTEARDHLVLAYWEHLAGRDDSRDEDLAAGSNQLAWVVENSSAPAGSDAEELLTLLNSLELHKQTDQTFVEDLRNLCEKVQMHLLSASLKLERPHEEVARVSELSHVPANGLPNQTKTSIPSLQAKSID